MRVIKYALIKLKCLLIIFTIAFYWENMQNVSQVNYSFINTIMEVQ